MFAESSGSQAKRRGIVLVVVLGMLGLMALIGVTFATFAGQSLINAATSVREWPRPQAETLMDYALAQLINDTNNPVSAIRGHSLLRDMYGNDSVFRGATPTINPASDTGGVLSSVYTHNGSPVNLIFTGVVPRVSSAVSPLPTPFYNRPLQYADQHPHGVSASITGSTSPDGSSGSAYGTVPQTFEVLEDDSTSAGRPPPHAERQPGQPLVGQFARLPPPPSSAAILHHTPIYFDPNNAINPYNTDPQRPLRGDSPDRTANPAPPYQVQQALHNADQGTELHPGRLLSNFNFPFPSLDGRYMTGLQRPAG